MCKLDARQTIIATSVLFLYTLLIAHMKHHSSQSNVSYSHNKIKTIRGILIIDLLSYSHFSLSKSSHIIWIILEDCAILIHALTV